MKPATFGEKKMIKKTNEKDAFNIYCIFVNINN